MVPAPRYEGTVISADSEGPGHRLPPPEPGPGPARALPCRARPQPEGRPPSTQGEHGRRRPDRGDAGPSRQGSLADLLAGWEREGDSGGGGMDGGALIGTERWGG